MFERLLRQLARPFRCTSRPARQTYRPRAEALEERTLLATGLLKDINRAAGSLANLYDPLQGTPYAVVGRTVFFAADDGTRGRELWKSDGSAAGTVLVKDIAASGSSSPTELVNVGGTLYFTADDGIRGRELWKSDGSTAGTVLVKDINTSASSFPQELTVVNDVLYFTADDGGRGRELWRSDGTDAGTVLVKNLRPDGTARPPSTYDPSEIEQLTEMNGVLYFTADDGVRGVELWRSDGTDTGTAMVADLFPGGSSRPLGLSNANGTLYFSAYDATRGRELWKSDGTAAGTVLIKDIVAGPGGSFYDAGLLGLPRTFVAVGQNVFFTADDGSRGEQLWKTDGTTGGTVLVKDLFPAVNRAVLASAGAEGPAPDYRATPSTATFLADLTAVNGTLFFTARDATRGMELWKSDGTANGTVLVKDIYSGNSVVGGRTMPNSSRPSGLARVGNLLYFTADDGVRGRELWKSDGSAAGTVLLQDANPGRGAGAGDAPVAVGDGSVYYAGNNGSSGFEPWRRDETAARDRAPTAVAGGPYSVVRGATVMLDARGSSDPDGDRLSYSWDLNGDGTFGDATGARLTFSSYQLSALGVRVATPALVKVRASDGRGLSADSAATTLTITLPVFTPNERYVMRLYRELLRRDAEDAGLAAWSGALDRDGDRMAIVRGILASREYRERVVRQLYLTYLHREAEPAGLEAFVTFFNQGGTVEQAAAVMVGSDEYFQTRASNNIESFLEALYGDALRRDTDAVGRDGFRRLLAAGVSRQLVAATVLGSLEYVQVTVRDFYHQFLSRSAETVGFDFFVAAFQRGARDEDMIAVLVSSEEFFVRS